MKKIILAFFIFNFSLLTLHAQTPVFYGMTSLGGKCGNGAIVSFNPVTNKDSVQWSFGDPKDGVNPYGSFAYDPVNGLYYGMTFKGGNTFKGAIISYNPANNSENIVWSFGNGMDGQSPEGSLTYDPVNGMFYGMTQAGGTYGRGTIIRFNPATNQDSVVWNLGNGADGAIPGYSSLVYDTNNGMFYGITSRGGSHTFGTIIRFNPVTNQDSVAWNFGAGADGFTPLGGDLVYDPNNGMYYAMICNGGIYNYGAIIRFNPVNNAESVVWNFGSGIDGLNPYGSLVYDTASGMFYGMTPSGGSYGNGVIIKFNPLTNQDSVAWSFGNVPDGEGPGGNLVYNRGNGLYYAPTSTGGANGKGAIISFNANTSAESVVCSLGSSKWDGIAPDGSLIYNAGTGLLYGMTIAGGSATYGTIIKFDPVTNQDSVVHNLGTGTDGACPEGELVYDTNRQVFYGMTYGGGKYSYGTIFQYNMATHKDSVMVNFDTGTDAENPIGNLVYYAGNGMYYGMSQFGGANKLGTIIRFNPVTNKDTIVWNFGNGTDGQNPSGNLVYNASKGLFYGMSDLGGTAGGGTIFSFNPLTNKDSVLWSFGVLGGDGRGPIRDLVYDSVNGLYYATTRSGGINSNRGTIITFNPVTFQENVVWNFGGVGTDGILPCGNLSYDKNNNMFYGMTKYGGVNTSGTIIKFDPSTNAETVLWAFTGGNDAAYPSGNFIYYPPNGLFYAMTELGGNPGPGTIITLNPNTNAENVLWTFGNGNDGNYPYGSFILCMIPCTNTYTEPICIATIDTATNKCEVIWGRTNSPPAGGAGAYHIYRDTIPGYKLIHSQPLDSLSEYIDTGSNPSAGPVSYKLSTLDSCGESALSATHTTMYLTTSAGPNVYILNWTPYVGFIPTRYRIFRGPTMGSLVQIDSVPTSVLTYHDTLPPVNSIYLVEAVSPNGLCVPSKHGPHNLHSDALLSGSFSNGFNAVALGVKNLKGLASQIKVYPNPNNGKFTMESSGLRVKSSVEIYNMLGEKVYSDPFSIHNSKFLINISSQPSGIYLYRVVTEKGDLAGEGKLIIE